MIYRNNINVNSWGQLDKCPKCGNEEIDSAAEYCKICGAYIIQKCLGEDGEYGNINFKRISGCECVPDGNARYCILCGSSTSLYYQSLLPKWEDETDTPSTTPYSLKDDDDLPF